MLSQSPSLPGFMGTLSFCVEASVKEVGGEKNLNEGDIILYNNPYGSGSHSQDAAIVMPVFINKNKLIGLCHKSSLVRHWWQRTIFNRHGRRVSRENNLSRIKIIQKGKVG